MAKAGAGKKRNSQTRALAVKAAVFAAAVLALTKLVFGVCICSGERMFPALRDGDLVIYSRLSELRQGDVVVFADPQDGTQCISRVVGLEGCEIDITEAGELKTNGYIPSESVFYRTERAEGSSVVFPLTVRQGEVFLLDDYRTIGRDSRVFGPVEKDRIKGRIIYIVRRRGF